MKIVETRAGEEAVKIVETSYYDINVSEDNRFCGLCCKYLSINETRSLGGCQKTIYAACQCFMTETPLSIVLRDVYLALKDEIYGTTTIKSNSGAVDVLRSRRCVSAKDVLSDQEERAGKGCDNN